MNRLLSTVVLWLGLALGGAISWAAEAPRLDVRHSPQVPKSGEKVTITMESANTLQSPVLEYQVVTPGKYIARNDSAYAKNWTSVGMTANGNQLSAEVPAPAQVNRNLVRYRIRAKTTDGKEALLPKSDDTEPNFAYFVYDGIPAWNGAIEPKGPDSRKSTVVQFSSEVMSQVQSYFLVARLKEVENATWYQKNFEKEYRYTGTFVADGKVYDHVKFRARGGEWRFAMGKNMWKFNFNKGHNLEAKDDYGHRYAGKWGKVNLRSCIQQGDYGRRGEQGMYEAVGFRLFNLAGVDAPRTHWVSLRIIGDREENTADQYRGDYWGLYLAIENEDGDFLDEHGLPDGNVYKMKFGQGELSAQGKGQPTDGSDLRLFLSALRRGGGAGEAWWRQHVDMPRYYSYRAILEGIHHYDISNGKNYDYYFNPKTQKWCVIPWDIDLTWGDHMYGGGSDPFSPSIARYPVLALEYQNRLREVRDLLFNPSETGRLIDEYAAIIYRAGQPSIVEADRRKWDFHPVMASEHATPGKADQGLFYQGVRSKDFAGMVEQMKAYVVRRCRFIDRSLLNDREIPAKPSITYAGAEGFPAGGLAFKTSAFSGAGPFAAMQWRAGRVDAKPVSGKLQKPGQYEITPAWLSDVSAQFNEGITVPPAALQAGNTYRVRCRMKDAAGRWSHWSDPVEFTVSK